LKEAIDYFNQAIEIDPNYAAAYAGLTDAYALAGDWKYGILAPRDAYPRPKRRRPKPRNCLPRCLRLGLGVGGEGIEISPATRPVTSGTAGTSPCWGEMAKLSPK